MERVRARSWQWMGSGGTAENGKHESPIVIREEGVPRDSSGHSN